MNRAYPRFLLALSLGVSVAACGGKATTTTATTPSAPQAAAATAATELAPPLPSLPSIPDAPQPAPASLAATVAIPPINALLANVGAYANAVMPGASAMLNADSLRQMMASELGAETVALFDFDRPLRALMLDPNALDDGDADEAAVLLIPVTSEDTTALAALAKEIDDDLMIITHGGYVAIGERAALIAGSPYALTSLIAEPAPEHPIVTLLASHFAAAYAEELEAGLAELRSELESGDLAAQAQMGVDPKAAANLLLEIVGGMARETRVVTLELAIDATDAALVFSIIPEPGSAMSQAVAGHANPDLTTLARLPEAPVLSITRMDWMRMLRRVAPVYDAKLIALYETAYAGATELAYSADFSEGRIAVTAGVVYETPAAAKKALAAIVKATEGMFDDAGAELQLEVKHKPRAYRHRGARVGRVEIASPAMPNAFHFDYALAGKSLGFALAVDVATETPSPEGTRALMTTWLDRNRGKAPPLAADLATATKATTAAGDNMVVFVDVVHFLEQANDKPSQTPHGVPASIGFDLNDRAAVIRLKLPASHARAIAPLVGGFGFGG